MGHKHADTSNSMFQQLAPGAFAPKATRCQPSAAPCCTSQEPIPAQALPSLDFEVRLLLAGGTSLPQKRVALQDVLGSNPLLFDLFVRFLFAQNTGSSDKVASWGYCGDGNHHSHFDYLNAEVQSKQLEFR